jgi:hypothetical protein
VNTLGGSATLDAKAIISPSTSTSAATQGTIDVH